MISTPGYSRGLNRKVEIDGDFTALTEDMVTLVTVLSEAVEMTSSGRRVVLSREMIILAYSPLCFGVSSIFRYRPMIAYGGMCSRFVKS